MIDSILITIKKMLGIQDEDKFFDQDIIVHINSVLNILYQVGVNSMDKPFSISGASESWSDFWSDSETLPMVKTYIYLRVKLIFDPPASSAVQEAIKQECSELIWRIYTQIDLKNPDEFSKDKIYSVGDTVRRNGKTFVCIKALTKSEPWNADNWKQYSDEKIPVFNILTHYSVGDKCLFANKKHVCIADTPAGDWVPDNWVEYTE
jgi:hypothetical protein